MIVVVALVTFFQSSNDPNAGLPEARRVVAECESHKIDPNLPPGVKQFRCPTVEQVRPEFSRSFDYAETMPDSLRGVAFAMLSLGLVIGASFVGAEWGGGAMTTMLTWEPRRGRLLAAKAIAGIAVVVVLAILLLALVTVIFLPVAALRGTTAGADGAVFRTLTGIWFRGAGLAAFGATMGMSFATVFRNTAGAVGTGLFYGAVVDPLFGSLWHARFRIWTFNHLVPRLVGAPTDVPERERGTSISVLTTHHLSITRPIVLFAIYGALMLGLAYAVFRSRDVT